MRYFIYFVRLNTKYFYAAATEGAASDNTAQLVLLVQTHKTVLFAATANSTFAPPVAPLSSSVSSAKLLNSKPVAPTVIKKVRPI
jgi:hypothetical protein